MFGLASGYWTIAAVERANLGQERRTKTDLLGLVVPDGVVQLCFGEFIERRGHRLDPSLSVAKYILRRTRRE